MSTRAVRIAGVLLLAAGLGVRAALVTPPPAEPQADLAPPQAAVPYLESGRGRRPDRPSAAPDAARSERPGTQGHLVAVLVRRPDGKPVPGATVSASRVALPSRQDPRGATPEPATTDASGRAELAVTEIPAAFVASKEAEVGIGIPVWFGDEGDPLPITITLMPVAAAEVEVVDSSGRVVRNATVSALVGWRAYQRFGTEGVRMRDGGVVSSNALVTWSARTDSSGFARFASLPPVDWEPADDVVGGSSERVVLVEAEGYRSAHAALADGPNRVVLTPAVECRARVVDEDGRAIREPAWASGPDARGRGDEDGRVVALVPDASPEAPPPPLVLDADGYVARTFDLAARAPTVVDLGTVVLASAVLLRGTVCHADGTPAGGVLVTADHESAGRVFVQGLTAPDGGFALEPPAEGVYRVSAGTPGAPQRGSARNSLWEAVAENVHPGEERRLVLQFVPGLLVRLVPPDPKPPGFSLDNVSIVPRSADGLGQYDWMPEDGGNYLVRLLGRGPWKVEVRHPQVEPVDFEVCGAPRGPDDDVLTREVTLRSVAR